MRTNRTTKEARTNREAFYRILVVEMADELQTQMHSYSQTASLTSAWNEK